MGVKVHNSANSAVHSEVKFAVVLELCKHYVCCFSVFRQTAVPAMGAFCDRLCGGFRGNDDSAVCWRAIKVGRGDPNAGHEVRGQGSERGRV